MVSVERQLGAAVGARCGGAAAYRCTVRKARLGKAIGEVYVLDTASGSLSALTQRRLPSNSLSTLEK